MNSKISVTTMRRFVRLVAATLVGPGFNLRSGNICGRNYLESVVHQEPTQRKTPASQGALRSSHCMAPSQGNDGIRFQRAVMARVARNAIFETTIVTPTETSTKSGAKNHRKGSRSPSNISLRRGDSIDDPRIRSSASRAFPLKTMKGDTSGV